MQLGAVQLVAAARFAIDGTATADTEAVRDRDHSQQRPSREPQRTVVPRSEGKLVRPPVSSAAPAQRILAVEFRSTDGRSWNAIGGGVGQATAPIRALCPHPLDLSSGGSDWWNRKIVSVVARLDVGEALVVDVVVGA